MKIRIVKRPSKAIEGISVGSFREGRVYDVSAPLANYLVAEGFAMFDRREENKKKPGIDRRRKK